MNPLVSSNFFMKVWIEDLVVNLFRFTQGRYDVYCQSKDMADFHNSNQN